MSYYPPQYGTIQPQYPTYPNQTYYPSHSHYTSQGGHNVYPAQQAVSHLPLPEPHTAPELSAVTDDVASRAMQRFMSSELRSAGFDSVEPSALRRLEHEVVTFVEQLYERAHEYANLANRAGPITQDLLLASADSGLQTKELRQLARKAGAKHQEAADFVLLPPPSRSPSPEMLPSDDEDAPPVIPNTLRSLSWSERNLPALPPKHTYLRTPVSPPKKAALPSLEKKLKNAGLVQESLKNLLLATEDSAGQEDGELLGAIVNWEATTHPRKRWRVDA